VLSYARRCLQHADRRSWAAALDAIAGYDRVGRTASIGIPVTLIAAELDQVSMPAAMSALASRLPAAILQIPPGAAHMTPFTDPVALAELILRAAGDDRRLPAPPLALPNPPCRYRIPESYGPDPLAVPSSRKPGRHRATSGATRF
jgi:hypothetical protein